MQLIKLTLSLAAGTVAGEVSSDDVPITTQHSCSRARPVRSSPGKIQAQANHLNPIT